MHRAQAMARSAETSTGRFRSLRNLRAAHALITPYQVLKAGDSIAN